MGHLTEGDLGYLRELRVYELLADEFTHLTDLGATADQVTIDDIDSRDEEVLVFSEEDKTLERARRIVVPAGVIRWSIENGHRHHYEHAIFDGHIFPLIEAEQVAAVQQYAGNLAEAARIRAQIETSQYRPRPAEDLPAYYLG